MCIRDSAGIDAAVGQQGGGGGFLQGFGAEGGAGEIPGGDEGVKETTNIAMNEKHQTSQSCVLSMRSSRREMLHHRRLLRRRCCITRVRFDTPCT